MTDKLEQWWSSLDAPVQEALLASPDGSIPAGYHHTVIHSGQLIVGAWWPGEQERPNALVLGPQVREFITCKREALAAGVQ